MTESDDSWLERTYSGAPNECGRCFLAGNIVKLDASGNCPREESH